MMPFLSASVYIYFKIETYLDLSLACFGLDLSIINVKKLNQPFYLKLCSGNLVQKSTDNTK